MKIVRMGLNLLLAAFLIFMGAQKFGDVNPIFQYIAEMSGMPVFEPTIRMLVGMSEILAAVLILVGVFAGKLKGLGAFISTGVLAGALGFHLSPWLGINAPMGFDPMGAYIFSPMLFYMAVAFFLISLVALYWDRDALKALVGNDNEADNASV